MLCNQIKRLELKIELRFKSHNDVANLYKLRHFTTHNDNIIVSHSQPFNQSFYYEKTT